MFRLRFPLPYDGPPRRALLPLALGTAVALLGDSTLYTVLPDPGYAAQAGISLSLVGVLLGSNRLARLLFNAPMGSWYDSAPRRPLLIGAALVGVLSTSIYWLTLGFWPYLVGRILWGAAWSALWIGGQTVVLDISDDDNRGRISGLYQMGFFAGVGGSALLGGVFTDWLGFRGGLMLSTALALVAALMWLFTLPETRPADRGADARTASSRPSFPWGVAATASLPIFTLRLVFAGVMASTTILWLQSLLAEGAPWRVAALPIASLTGFFVALRTFITMAGAPLTGALSDLLKRRWLVIGASLAAGAAGTWVMGDALPPLAFAGALVAASTSGGTQALVTAFAGDRVGLNQRGRVIGAAYTVGDVGSALGPPLALSLLGVLPLSTIYRASSLLLLAAALFSFIFHFASAHSAKPLSPAQNN